MNLESTYKDVGAYLQGHFLLSSGKHSEFYLQSAKVLENPEIAGKLADELARVIAEFGVEFDSICSPALGGVLAGYELARAAKKRFIFTERVVRGEKFIVCEDVITTGGSALESAKIIESLGGEVVAFAALANRGFCAVKNLGNARKNSAKLPEDKPLFTLGNFDFDIYESDTCPLCKSGSVAIKPGSRGN